MKIVHERPPNYETIIAAFPTAAIQRGVLFAYGDTLYNPDGVTIDPFLWAHEKTHQAQQAGLPAEWWKLYIASVDFRFDQELEAHRAEWQAFLNQHDQYGNTPARRARRTYISGIAHRLGSPLYGSMVGSAKAKYLIAAEGPPNLFNSMRVAPTGRSAWVQDNA